MNEREREGKGREGEREREREGGRRREINMCVRIRDVHKAQGLVSG